MVKVKEWMKSHAKTDGSYITFKEDDKQVTANKDYANRVSSFIGDHDVIINIEHQSHVTFSTGDLTNSTNITWTIPHVNPAFDPLKVRMNQNSGVWLILSLAERFYNATHDQTLHEMLLETLEGYSIPYEPTQQLKLNIPTRLAPLAYNDTIVNSFLSTLNEQIDEEIRDKLEKIMADARLKDANTERKRWLEMILHGYGLYQRQPRNTIPKDPPYTKSVVWICHNAYKYEVNQITFAMQSAMSSLLTVPVYHPYFQDLRDFNEQQRKPFLDQMKRYWEQYIAALDQQLNKINTAWLIENGGKLKRYSHFRAFAEWQFSNRSKTEVAEEYGFLSERSDANQANVLNAHVIKIIASIIGITPRE